MAIGARLEQCAICKRSHSFIEKENAIVILKMSYVLLFFDTLKSFREGILERFLLCYETLPLLRFQHVSCSHSWCTFKGVPEAVMTVKWLASFDCVEWVSFHEGVRTVMERKPDRDVPHVTSLTGDFWIHRCLSKIAFWIGWKDVCRTWGIVDQKENVLKTTWLRPTTAFNEKCNIGL